MRERIPDRDFAEELAHDFVRDLKLTHPGIVEEWERQRADAINSGEDEREWPDIQSASGIAWWLESEIPLAEEHIDCSTDPDYIKDEESIRGFCAGAATLIRQFLAEGEG